MRRAAWSGGLVVLAVLVSAQFSAAAERKMKNPHIGKVRHVVLFGYKEGTSDEKVQQIEDAFRGLGKKIPFIVDFECGTNCSPEGLSKGLTACFLVTFENEQDRDKYLPHPAHKEFVTLLKPHLEDVLVVDYVVKE
jgi:hypothetical protein